jgi:hypothetical protein
LDSSGSGYGPVMILRVPLQTGDFLTLLYGVNRSRYLINELRICRSFSSCSQSQKFSGQATDRDTENGTNVGWETLV